MRILYLENSWALWHWALPQPEYWTSSFWPLLPYSRDPISVRGSARTWMRHWPRSTAGPADGETPAASRQSAPQLTVGHVGVQLQLLQVGETWKLGNFTQRGCGGTVREERRGPRVKFNYSLLLFFSQSLRLKPHLRYWQGAHGQSCSLPPASPPWPLHPPPPRWPGRQRRSEPSARLSPCCSAAPPSAGAAEAQSESPAREQSRDSSSETPGGTHHTLFFPHTSFTVMCFLCQVGHLPRAPWPIQIPSRPPWWCRCNDQNSWRLWRKRVASCQIISSGPRVFRSALEVFWLVSTELYDSAGGRTNVHHVLYIQSKDKSGDKGLLFCLFTHPSVT